jgi:hypothetical protein
MNMGLLIGLMFANAVIIALIPYIGFVSFFNLYKMGTTNTYLLLGIYITILIVSYGLSFGSFALIQSETCGSVKNFKQIASNSAIVSGIQGIGMLIAAFVPILRSFVHSILPNWLGHINRESIAYGYFAFWYALFGIAIGGSFSAVC